MLNQNQNTQILMFLCHIYLSVHDGLLIVDILCGRQAQSVAHGRGCRAHLVAQLLRLLNLGAPLCLHFGVVGVARAS